MANPEPPNLSHLSRFMAGEALSITPSSEGDVFSFDDGPISSVTLAAIRSDCPGRTCETIEGIPGILPTIWRRKLAIPTWETSAEPYTDKGEVIWTSPLSA